MIYFDNAATSWPKPDCVSQAMSRFMAAIGANPGRSGHRLANEAERIRFAAREAIAEVVDAPDPLRIIFTPNGTTALNLAIQGLLAPNTHVVTTGMEHNAVMRPLRAIEQRGVSISVTACQPDGTLDPAAVANHIRPDTRLIVVNHASNVCGTVLPIRAIGALARAHAIPFLVDATQTAGVWPINMADDNIDLLAFTGHKGLLGPPGTGGLVLGTNFDANLLPSLINGGTGSLSEHEHQPDFLPDKYEAGTPNTVGLAGLEAGARHLLKRGIEDVRRHERLLAERLIRGLGDIEGVTVLGTRDADRQTAVVSFTLAGRSCADVAHELDERFAIMCRPGLHCAPPAHRTLGTFPEGTVRLAPGLLSTANEVDQAVAAVAELSNGSKK